MSNGDFGRLDWHPTWRLCCASCNMFACPGKVDLQQWSHAEWLKADSNSIWENNKNSNNQRRREFTSTCCFVETICVDSLIHGKEIMLKRCIQSTSKYQEKDIRLGCWLPSLGHGSILPQPSVPEFGQLDIAFFNKQLLFIFWTLDSTYLRNTPLRNAYHRRLFFCLRLQRVRRGAAGACLKHGWMEVIGHHSTKQIPATGKSFTLGTNSECPHCYHGFLSENLRVDGIRVTPKLHLITRNRWEHWKPHHLLGWCLGRGKWSSISLTHAKREGIWFWTYQLILRALSDLNIQGLIFLLTFLLTCCFRMLQTPGTANVLGFLKSLRRTFLVKLVFNSNRYTFRLNTEKIGPNSDPL